jgi:hypothetical protein
VKPAGQIEETHYACFTASVFRLSASLAIKGIKVAEMDDTSASMPVSAAMLPLPPFSDPPCRDTMRADQQGVPSLMPGLPRMRHVSSHLILPEGGKRQMDDAPTPAERACSSAGPPASQRSEKRAPPSYDETRQLYFKSLQGHVRLWGAHLPNIQMVAKIGAGPDQNDRERQASPAELRSVKRPLVERRFVAGGSFFITTATRSVTNWSVVSESVVSDARETNFLSGERSALVDDLDLIGDGCDSRR